jgi:glutamate-1-semialdehyde 2,1-aminomutase
VKRAAAEALTAAGVPHVVQSAGTMFSIFLSDTPVRCFDDARRTDEKAYAAFFHSMLDQGVYLPPSAFEAWFLSSAHDDAALDRIVTALPAAVRAALAVPSPEGAR